MTVYFIQQGRSGPIKIGHAKTMRNRLSTLQTGNPEQLFVRLVLPGGRKEEAELHRQFATHRIRLEWFEPAAPILEFIHTQRVGSMVHKPWRPSPRWETAKERRSKEAKERIRKLLKSAPV